MNNPVKRWLATQSAGDYDEAQIRATLERMVAADDIVIISATYCPFSMAAKRVLEAKGVSFQAYEWNKREDGAALVAELGVLTGALNPNTKHQSPNPRSQTSNPKGAGNAHRSYFHPAYLGRRSQHWRLQRRHPGKLPSCTVGIRAGGMKGLLCVDA